jgi:hypothetical protein
VNVKLPDLDNLPAIEDMTLDAMQAEFVALAEPFAFIDTRRRMLARAIEEKRKAAEAVNRVSAMSDEEKAALRAALGG